MVGQKQIASYAGQVPTTLIVDGMDLREGEVGVLEYLVNFPRIDKKIKDADAWGATELPNGETLLIVDPKDLPSIENKIVIVNPQRGSDQRMFGRDVIPVLTEKNSADLGNQQLEGGSKVVVIANLDDKKNGQPHGIGIAVKSDLTGFAHRIAQASDKDIANLKPEAGPLETTTRSYEIDADVLKEIYRIMVTVDLAGHKFIVGPKLAEYINKVFNQPDASGVGFFFGGSLPVALTDKDYSYAKELQYLAPEDLRAFGVEHDREGFFIRVRQDGKEYRRYLPGNVMMILPTQFNLLSTKVDSVYPIVVQANAETVEKNIAFEEGRNGVLGALRAEGAGSFALTENMLRILTDNNLLNGTLTSIPTYTFNEKPDR